MSQDRTVTITADHYPEVQSLLHRLPGILTGRIPDEHGIGMGFRARLGHGLISLIGPNFDRMSRGEAGADGTVWPDLTPEYLAYGRRFGPTEKSELMKGAGLSPKQHKHGPNDTKGLLSKQQLLLWRKTFSDRYAWYVMREPDGVAKAHAAAIAWIVVKKAGAKTKLEVFGDRKVQILVDTGYLRSSLLPGELIEGGLYADYHRPSTKGGNQQFFDADTPYRIIVGTNVKYAKYHHYGSRPLWPVRGFPEDWWQQILGVAISGLQNIADIFREGGL